jgi:hypothetical protein
MNKVFVLGTGRCGTVTFSHACRHLTNFTVGHETPIPEDLNFGRQDHIEVSPRLTWVLSLLEYQFAQEDGTFFVQLQRDKQGVCDSWTSRGQNRGASHFGRLTWGDQSRPPPDVVNSMCYDSMTWAISQLGERYPHKYMLIRLETVEQQWDEFCTRIGAAGDLDAGRAEFKKKYNATRRA